MEINAIRDEVHELAKSKGWWNADRSLAECLALIHSEISEALEELRNNKHPDELYFEGEKPCGFPVELADAVIRILDLCGKLGLDIDRIIMLKHEYNKSRPFRHGNKGL